MKKLYLIIILISVVPAAVLAQIGSVRGKVVDSTKTPIPGATVTLTAGTDTLRVITDTAGVFRFSAPKITALTISVSSLGYLTVQRSYLLEANTNDLEVPEIVLNQSATLLKAVQIRATVKPVTVKQDTLEFNALAYPTQPGDRVRELIRQLPGVTVDKDGNVTAMGKKVVRVKVNGKDFFTGNIKELLAQLPADLISKVQLIKDYGELANFTGERSGIKPVKIINLTTKAGVDSGVFGDVKTELGSNDHYGILGNGKYWRGNRQISANGKSETGNNGAGTALQHAAGLSWNDHFGNGFEGGISYQYSTGRSAGKEISQVETFGSNTNFSTMNSRDNESKNRSQGLKLQLKRNGIKSYFAFALEKSSVTDTSHSILSSRQDGSVTMDLLNTADELSRQQPIKGNLLYAYRFDKPGRSFSLSIDGSITPSTRTADLHDLIGYRDQAHGVIKDSLLLRRTDDQNRSWFRNSVLSYTEPLGETATGVKRSINLNYVIALQSGRGDLETTAADRFGIYRKVDSLSTRNTSRQFQQAIQVQYANRNERFEYILGATLQSAILSGTILSDGPALRRSDKIVLPSAGFKYRPTTAQSLELSYTSDMQLPELRYLRSVVDTRNLRQIVIGNPQLKSAISHVWLMSYEREGTAGLLFQFNAGFQLISDKTVSNTTTSSDSLGALHQITSFINANGDQNFESRYNLSLPLFKERMRLELEGGLGYETAVFFAEGQREISRQTSLQQAAKFRLNTKRIDLNAGVAYALNYTRFSVNEAPDQSTQVWNLTSEARITLTDNFRFAVQARKTLNSGLLVQQTNPLIVDVSAELMLLKYKQASIQLQTVDLLAQNNNSSKQIFGNTVMDSRSNQLTRYFQLNITYRLDRFSKKK